MASNSDESVTLFFKHIVPIYFTFQKDQDVEMSVITAFVLSISDHWYLITAGHCIDEINEKIERGYKITRCELYDYFGLEAKNRTPIPFLYERSNPVSLSDGYGFDYGVMVLSAYYKGLLQANNIQPLNEEVWKHQPPAVDLYRLVGIPAEPITVDPVTKTLDRVLAFSLPIEQIEKPDAFRETEAPFFYGHILSLGELDSIAGMSGGPIFAIHRNESGETHYWLTALQSRWLTQSHNIAACPTTLLGHFLEDVIGQMGQE